MVAAGPDPPGPTEGRLAAGAAIVAGGAWIAKGVGERITPDPDYWDCNSSYDYVLNGIDTVAFLATAFAIVQIARRDLGTGLRIVGLVSALMFATAGVSNVLEHCASVEALGFAYVVGLIVGILSLIVLAVALAGGADLPSLAAWILAASTLLLLLFAEQGGLIAFGVGWLAYGATALVAARREG